MLSIAPCIFWRVSGVASTCEKLSVMAATSREMSRMFSVAMLASRGMVEVARRWRTVSTVLRTDSDVCAMLSARRASLGPDRRASADR